MKIVELWERNKKTIYLSYMVVAGVLIAVYLYSLYKYAIASDMHSLTTLFLLGFLGYIPILFFYDMLREFRGEQKELDEKNILSFSAIVIVMAAVIHWYNGEYIFIKNEYILLFLPAYLYFLLPGFVFYKKQIDCRSRHSIIAFIILFIIGIPLSVSLLSLYVSPPLFIGSMILLIAVFYGMSHRIMEWLNSPQKPNERTLNEEQES